MVGSKHYGIYAPISAIYPDEKDDDNTFKRLRNSLRLTEALFWCDRLNKIITEPSKYSDHERQQCAIQMLFQKRK
jgi:hypothetical protein